jgi:hypothetical protein
MALEGLDARWALQLKDHTFSTGLFNCPDHWGKNESSGKTCTYIYASN